jgi:hypothetical protein
MPTDERASALIRNVALSNFVCFAQLDKVVQTDFCHYNFASGYQAKCFRKYLATVMKLCL